MVVIVNGYDQTLAKPSAVPVCVPKKIVTFFFPSSTSTSGSLTINGLGSSTAFGFWPLDRRHIKTTKQPINTATEVVKIVTSSRFSIINEATSAATESDDMLEGSNFPPLMIAVIRSNGESFIELEEEDSIVQNSNKKKKN